MKECIKCRRMIPDQADFCPYCGEKQVRSQPETDREFVFCPMCGKKIPAATRFCPECGAEIPVIRGDGEAQYPKKIISEASSYSKDTKRDTTVPGKKKSKGILTVLGILFGIIYLWTALRYIPYLNYYNTSDKIWGVCMIAAYVWSAFILFLIAVNSRKENGRPLLYCLYMGTAAACILYIYDIFLGLRYGWYVSSGDGRMFMQILVAAGCCFLMNKYDLLLSREECGAVKNVIREIPDAIHDILFSQNTDRRNGKAEEMGMEFVPEGLSSAQKVMWRVCGSKWALVFCIVYTGDLFFRMILHFTFTGLIGYILSLLICIGTWMIYSGSKNNTLNSTGFSMINVVVTIDLVIWLSISIFLTIMGFVVLAAGELVVGFLILAAAVLLGFYWWALRKTTHCSYYIAKGADEQLYSSIWPVIILGINSVWKIVMFLWRLSLQLAANQASNSIMQYSNKLSSDVASVLDMFGLDYGYGYGGVSSGMQMITGPIIDWIQSFFGFNENVFEMLFAVILPLSATVLLAKIRSEKNEALF